MNHKQNSIKGIKMKEVNLYLNHYYLNIVSKYLLEISILNLQTNSQKQREYVAKIFLYYLQLNNLLQLQYLNRENIINFLKEFNNYSKFTIKDYLAMLKVFLKFLYLNHYIKEPFYLTLPKAHIPKQSKIPSVWDTKNTEKLLNSIDRTTSIGKRDYAILLLIIKLGLRKIDVITLKFNNINWNNKTINIVQQKTKGPISLPLLNDVGWAIIDYIKNGRPQINIENIFVTHQKPINSFSRNHGNFYSIIAKYMKKAHISITKEKKNGVHSLRHTLASEMLKQSTPIETISSVLGHVNSNSTSIYLKIDIEKLRECVLEVIQ